MTVSSVDVRALRYQCEECGVPVDTVEVIDGPAALVRREPCGHEANLADMMPGRDTTTA